MSEFKYLESEIAHLQKDIDELKVQVTSLRTENKEILRFIHEAQGGKRYILFLITVFTGVGAAIASLINYIK